MKTFFLILIFIFISSSLICCQKENDNHSKCLYEFCDYENPFRVFARMTGKLIVKENNPNGYFTMKYYEDKEGIIPNSDIFVFCDIPNQGKRIRNVITEIFSGFGPDDNRTLYNIDNVSVPGYFIYYTEQKDPITNETNSISMNNFLFDSVYDPNNTYIHWYKQDLEFFHGPYNYCNETDGKTYPPQRNLSILCRNEFFNLISKVSGKYVCVENKNTSVALRLPGSEDVIEGSDIWQVCADESGEFLKNNYTQNFLYHENDFNFTNNASIENLGSNFFIQRTSFLGLFSNIWFPCNENDTIWSCAVGDGGEQLIFVGADEANNSSNLIIQWIKHLV